MRERGGPFFPSLKSNNKPTNNTQGDTMNKRTAQRYTHLVNSLALLGFTMEETDKLLKIEKTLHRWHELECNGDIQRDEVTEKPFVIHHYTGNRYPYPDKEKGALKRLAEILKDKPVTFYQQGDPRGCALYLIRPNDVPEGERVECYYSRGIALCID